VLIAAVFIAFVTSGIRVALMAVVVSNQELNTGTARKGNQIFATISILIYGLLPFFASAR